jgi:hypothetical protein
MLMPELSATPRHGRRVQQETIWEDDGSYCTKKFIVNTAILYRYL